MVISDDFIWLHFPKTAGTSTEKVLRKLFGKVKTVHFDKIDHHHIIWHHTIAKRRAHDPDFSPSGKKLICGFRRLPHWLLSRIYFEYSRNPQRIVTRDMLLRGQFFEAKGDLNNADVYARRYSPDVTHWIRTEHLVDDFYAVFGPLSGVKQPRIEKYFAKGKNRTKVNYIKDIQFYFSAAELAQLYACNPLWARIEQEIYGNLLEL